MVSLENIGAWDENLPLSPGVMATPTKRKGTYMYEEGQKKSKQDVPVEEVPPLPPAKPSPLPPMRPLEELFGDDIDPVLVFALAPSVQIHLCLGLLSSPVQPGANTQQSHQNLVDWIQRRTMGVASIGQSNLYHPEAITPCPPNGILRQTRPYHPLVYQSCH